MTERELSALLASAEEQVRARLIEKLVDHAAEIALKKGDLQVGVDRYILIVRKLFASE
jgi:hypothetical protein